MAKNISHKQWIEALEELYNKQTEYLEKKMKPDFETWLDRISVTELLKYIKKLENQ